MDKKELKKLIESKKTLRLDVGCGANKMDGFLGIDVRPLEGVDIVHNLEKFPWPIPDDSCKLVHASHVLEHINPSNTDPKLVGLIDLLIKKKVISKKDAEKSIGEYEVFGNFIRFMDEIWRITEEGGKFHFVVPYAGSTGYWQDPTHINPITEVTMFYFDPTHQSRLWTIYKPKPWKIEVNTFQKNSFLEVVIIKIKDEREKYEKEEKNSKKD